MFVWEIPWVSPNRNLMPKVGVHDRWIGLNLRPRYVRRRKENRSDFGLLLYALTRTKGDLLRRCAPYWQKEFAFNDCPTSFSKIHSWPNLWPLHPFPVYSTIDFSCPYHALTNTTARLSNGSISRPGDTQQHQLHNDSRVCANQRPLAACFVDRQGVLWIARRSTPCACRLWKLAGK